MGPFGSNIKVETFVPSGVPVISGQHLHKTRLEESSGYNFITHEHASRLRNSLVGPDDIVFTHAGTIGQVSLVPPNSLFPEYVISQRQFYLRLNRALADPMFVTYWFHGPVGRHRLLMHASQVGVPSISRPATNLRNIEIELPPLPEQRAIAATLGTLDDKVELNRKMNAKLEAMARALFRDWFVDFGPTRAKMAGRAPYLSPDLWPLFPDRLDAEGKPDGWEVFSLGHIADHHTRTLSPSESPDALFEHFSLPAFDRDQNPALDHGATIKSNKTLVPPGAILLSKLNPEIPRVWLPEMPNGRQQIASTEFLAYTGKEGALRGLLFCLFSDDDFRKMLQAMVTGTSKSHQRISPPDLLRREVISGTAELFRRFDDSVMPLLNRVLANRAESRTLAQTRDLLLPKLMSGEVRVKDAEQLVGEAT